jgi:hypothetical protein
LLTSLEKSDNNINLVQNRLKSTLAALGIKNTEIVFSRDIKSNVMKEMNGMKVAVLLVDRNEKKPLIEYWRPDYAFRIERDTILYQLSTGTSAE